MDRVVAFGFKSPTEPVFKLALQLDEPTGAVICASEKFI